MKTKKTTFSLDFQNKLNQGLEKRLDVFWKHIENLSLIEMERKILRTSTPFINRYLSPLLYSVKCKLIKRREALIRYLFFFPHSLACKKSNNPTILPFVLKPGIEMKLPINVETPMAKFLSVNYLKEDVNNKNMFQHARNKLIKIELTKYFNKQDEIQMSIKLGSLWKKQTIKEIRPPSKIKKFFSRFKRKKVKEYKPIGLYPIDLETMTDGIGLDGFVNFPFLKEKSKINKYFNQYKMRVFINRLSISLKEPAQKTLEESFKKNLTFSALFDKKNSFISFRLKKGGRKEKPSLFF